jgi:hypothetical protein
MKPTSCPECGGPVELRVSPRYEREYVCLGTCGTRWPKFDFELAQTAEVQR